MLSESAPPDRLAKIQDALAAMQEDKTYKRLIKAIGENLNFINGPEYEKLRPEQNKTFGELVKTLAQ